MRRLLVAAAGIALFLPAACTASKAEPAPTEVTHTRTVVSTRTPSVAPFTPAPATTVAPLPPGRKPAAGEVEKRCPYIASSPTENAQVNVADLNGSHVYRTTVVTTLKPVGCRFYFYSGPFQAMADIVPRTFATATDAHNAMVRTATAGTGAQSQPGIAPGVDAILYQTKFFGADGSKDWACVFAKGTVMVIVHTDQTNTSYNALQIAKAVTGRF